MYLHVRPTYRNTLAHKGVCCLFVPDLCDGLGMSLYHVSWIRWWLISITYTPHCCLAGLCRQVCVGAEGRGRERRMRYSCMWGCERVFYIAGCRRVWQVCSGVVLNGFLNIGRPIVETALAVCEWSCSVGGCRHLSVSCGRPVWTETVPMSYVRVPRAPLFLQCCHGNRSVSLLLEVLCEEEEPTWQRTVVSTWQKHQRAVENLQCHTSLCFVFGGFIESWEENDT